MKNRVHELHIYRLQLHVNAGAAPISIAVTAILATVATPVGAAGPAPVVGRWAGGAVWATRGATASGATRGLA